MILVGGVGDGEPKELIYQNNQTTKIVCWHVLLIICEKLYKVGFDATSL